MHNLMSFRHDECGIRFSAELGFGLIVTALPVPLSDFISNNLDPLVGVPLDGSCNADGVITP